MDLIIASGEYRMSETLDIGAVFLPKEMVGKRVIVMEVNAELLADEIGLLVRPMTLSRGAL